ncbi:MAG: cysteine--tRNA ligase [Candidatus Bipolaricaulota bacterium]|nr:cysteine--tRNA ligase [Candidatus Bipolaricaulota bacterium]
MRLHNTLTHREEKFFPKDGKTVRMYVCGPTVYDHLHIGNLRPIIVFGALRKYLERFKGWTVLYVENVTDVDDKLIERSKKTGDSVEALAARYTEAYFDLLRTLGTERPTASPRATEHIPQMVALVQTLVDKGYAYEKNGDVYYRVAAFADYGKLSGRRTEDQEVGARVALSEEKENPLDFTLWKRAKPGEPKWPSPWGAGRPGWHTECVVLSRQYLGEPLDIHAGGSDLIFPHHENEIAQAEAATGKPFFRFFLHNGMLNFHGEKMSKSLGNFAYAHEVLEKFDAETVRYFYLSRHYRKPLDFSDEGLEEAKKALARVETVIDEIEAEPAPETGEEAGPAGQAFLELLPGFRARYLAEMDSDLNTVGGLAAIQELVAETNRFRSTARGSDRQVLREAVALVRELGWPLGLFQEKGRVQKGLEDELIRLLIDLRAELRKKKEFALADRIRDRLTELGVELKDTAQGTIWT